jgi:hypothetical protein
VRLLARWCAGEVCSYIGLFGAYELMKSLALRGDGAAEEPPSALYTVVSGGAAGVACWTLSYPQDVVRVYLLAFTRCSHFARAASKPPVTS